MTGSGCPDDHFPSHLQKLRKLGRGACGTVYLCQSATGEQFAVKHIRDATSQSKSVLREVKLLAGLKHENLLHLVDFLPSQFQDFSEVYLVLPYLPFTLEKIIRERRKAWSGHVEAITYQILHALTFLHSASIAHRDLKPANVLVMKHCSLPGSVKVCDFGLARGDMQLDQAGALTEYVVTRWYRAPEVMLLKKHYSSAVDLWSVGCILVELLSRRPPIFPGTDYRDMLRLMVEKLGSPSDDDLCWLSKDSPAYRFVRRISKESLGYRFEPLSAQYPEASGDCLDLIGRLLCWNKVRRITARQAQEHAYFRDLPMDRMPEPVLMQEPFDWSFDDYPDTSIAIHQRLHDEYVRFHREEILAAKKAHLGKALLGPPPESLQAPL